MFAIMVLAHLLGDYILQFNVIARWKARSLWGVVAHGGIVTAANLVCTVLTAPAWWPYAILIGLIHTAIDVLRARVIRTKDTSEDLIWFLLDQMAHLTVIAGVVLASNAPALGELPGALGPVASPELLALMIGYVLLLQPAWVLLRFLVRGMYGADAAPHLGAGEKYEPMVERVLIATCVMAGAFYLTPLVLLPRRVTSIKMQGNGLGVMMQLTTHWAETFLGVILATGVGLIVRLVVGL